MNQLLNPPAPPPTQQQQQQQQQLPPPSRIVTVDFSGRGNPSFEFTPPETDESFNWHRFVPLRSPGGFCRATPTENEIMRMQERRRMMEQHPHYQFVAHPRVRAMPGFFNRTPPQLHSSPSSANNDSNSEFFVPEADETEKDLPDDEESKKKKVCVICQSRESVCMAVPCKHKNYCITCARKYGSMEKSKRNCAHCRKPMAGLVDLRKVFD